MHFLREVANGNERLNLIRRPYAFVFGGRPKYNLPSKHKAFCLRKRRYAYYLQRQEAYRLQRVFQES